MAQQGSSGAAAFNLQKRTLTLKPAAAELRVALFSGSALRSPGLDVVAYLRRTQADVFIVLGGLGRSHALAQQTASMLSSLQRLVLVVRGGADGFHRAFPAADNVLDASGVRSVRIGQDHLVLWPGAEQGRYALSPNACGFDEADLKLAEDELGAAEPGERRWLLAWQAPEPGSPLSDFKVRVGAIGGLFAWPPANEVADAAQITGSTQLVPRAWGPRMEAPDGHPLARGALVLRFDRDGPHSAR